jgi:transcriptional regulator with XRE-family HTH domain
MPLPPDRRRELGAFLRARREAITPSQAGLLPASRDRRRTPGLRREELAQICGISTTWYTWTEQGRDIALSAEALARLAVALRMTPAERAYLFELTKRRDPAPAAVQRDSAATPPELTAILQATNTPAYLLDRLWHARGWNQQAADLFQPWFETGDSSLLRFVFLTPAARDFICDWQDRACRLLAEFRADIVHDPQDELVSLMVRDLKRDSPDFERIWNSHMVLGRDGGWRSFNHPARGLLHYEQLTLVPSSHPHFKIVLLLPNLSIRNVSEKKKALLF